MSALHRKNCLLLLLIVLASHASLTLHFNSHVAVDQQPCEICTHYSNLEHASAPPPATLLPLAVFTPEIFTDSVRVSPAAASPYQPRAPPHAA